MVELERTFAWFNKSLPCPAFSKANWPKDAVSWFKDDAGGPIKRIWNIIALLREHGASVRVLRSKNPGKLLYEDDYQVVVEEWKKI